MPDFRASALCTDHEVAANNPSKLASRGTRKIVQLIFRSEARDGEDKSRPTSMCSSGSAARRMIGASVVGRAFAQSRIGTG